MKLIPNWGRWRPTKQERHLPLHRDPRLEIIFVHRGTVSWVYEGETVLSPPRSFVLGWPWEAHGAAGGTVPQCEIYWIQLPLAKRYSRYTSAPMLHPSFGLDAEEQKRLMGILNRRQDRIIPGTNLSCEIIIRMVHELASGPTIPAGRIKAMTHLLLQELAESTETKAVMHSQPVNHSAQVKRFVETLPDRCGEPWSLDSMAEFCGLGRSRFSAIVSSLTGDTPLRLLNRIRVDRARQLLSLTDQSITQIGFDCGFNSSQYFARVFQEFTGQTPSACRRRTRK